MTALINWGLSLIGGRTWILWLVGAAVAAVLAGYVGWLKWTIADLERDVARRDAVIARVSADLATARQNLTDAIDTIEANRATVARLEADRVNVETTLAEDLARVEARCSAVQTVRKEVRRVQIENPAKCPVPDSTRTAMRRLYGGPGPGTPGGDADRTRGGDAAR